MNPKKNHGGTFLVKKSYAKVNIFLKIAGRRGNYHELVSRFVRVHSLYDTITFEAKQCEKFTLIGTFGCETQKNTIYKAYEVLKKYSSNVETYFENHCVKVEKRIPEFAGLGGGSSNCATFMLMVNEVCNLGLTKDYLAQLGVQIGADVPFFVYEYDSANVTGIGEIVQKFEEESLSIKTVTPPILCNTGEIFTRFRENFYKEIFPEDAEILLHMSSKKILEKLSIEEANDLYAPAVEVYPKLTEYNKKGFYFSGSGSSFFKLKSGSEDE